MDRKENVSQSEIKRVAENPYFAILASGEFAPDQVEVAVAKPEEKPGELQALIDQTWDARNSARAAKGQKPMTDNPQLSLTKIDTYGNGHLRLAVSLCGYKDLIGLQNPEVKKQFPEFNPVIVGTNIVVKTADNKLLVVQRGLDQATKPGALSVVGGQPDLKADLDESGQWNPYKTITRELEEETGITPKELEKLVMTGVIFNKTVRNASVVFSTETKLTAAEIKQRMGDGEVIVKFLPNDIAELSRAILWWAPAPSPSGQAALTLYGQKEYGSDWPKWINERAAFWHKEIYGQLTREQMANLEKDAAEWVSRLE